MADDDDKKDEKNNSSGSSKFMDPGAKAKDEEVAEANKKVDKINDLISELKSPGISLARIMAIKKEIGTLMSEVDGIIDASVLSTLKMEIEQDIAKAVSRETIVEMYLPSVSDLLSQEAQQSFEKEALERKKLRDSSEASLKKFAKYSDPKTKEKLDRLHKKAHRGEHLTEEELNTLRNLPVPTEAELAKIKNNREKLAKDHKDLTHKCNRLQKAKEEAIKKHPHKKADIEKAIDPVIKKHKEEIEKTEKSISKHDEFLSELTRRAETLERDRQNKEQEIERSKADPERSANTQHEQKKARFMSQELQKEKDTTFAFHPSYEDKKEKEKFVTTVEEAGHSLRPDELHNRETISQGLPSNTQKTPEEKAGEHAAKILQKMAKFQPKKPPSTPNPPTPPDKGRGR